MVRAQTELIERLRDLLAYEPVLREVSMFGGCAFLVNEKLIVSAQKNGDLLVRIPADRHDELLARPGATQAVMGQGRQMGPGWITVEAAAIRDELLSSWVGLALEHIRAARRPR